MSIPHCNLHPTKTHPKTINPNFLHRIKASTTSNSILSPTIVNNRCHLLDRLTHIRPVGNQVTTTVLLHKSHTFLFPFEGFMTRPLHLGNGPQLPQPSYNFRNTPSFDFTHQPTSAARKTDKRPGEVNDFNTTNAGPTRTSTDCSSQHNGGSSSSNSSSVSPRHKSKRTCPETKEIDCTTDAGFWIQKQYYHALDDASKELFDSLLDKLEKIRIANDENAARKQQRLVGRNRASKSRAFMTSTTHTNGEKDSANAKVS